MQRLGSRAVAGLHKKKIGAKTSWDQFFEGESPSVGKMIGPLATGQGTERKYNEPVANCFQNAQVYPSKGRTGGCQRPKVTQRGSSRTPSYKYQVPRFLNTVEPNQDLDQQIKKSSLGLIKNLPMRGSSSPCPRGRAAKPLPWWSTPSTSPALHQGREADQCLHQAPRELSCIS